MQGGLLKVVRESGLVKDTVNLVHQPPFLAAESVVMLQKDRACFQHAELSNSRCISTAKVQTLIFNCIKIFIYGVLRTNVGHPAMSL